MRTRCRLPVLIGLLTLGCAADAPPPTASQPPPPSTAASVDDEAPPPVDERPIVVFLGDSLTAGYGLDEHQAFPARVDSALADRGRPIRMINAGVSGDTSAGGLARLDWLLRQAPDIVVVSLGANDGLRGVELASTEANLRTIVERSLATGARVLLSGMQIPPNYGQDYTEGFAALYPRLATELDVPLVPFLLDGVAGDPALNQADGIHPTAEGQEILAATVLAYLEPLLDTLAETTPDAPATDDARPNGDTEADGDGL